jgi:hypothetical protein
MPASRSPGRFDVMADDDHAVANAGPLLTRSWPSGWALRPWPISWSIWVTRPGASRPGRKILSLAQAIVADGDSTGRRRDVAGWRDRAGVGAQGDGASTCGTYLRSFTFGHIRQLDQLSGEILSRAWAAGAGPGDAR